MLKVMFVCHGNICRSPMAEFLLKEMVKNKGVERDFFISSSATSDEEIGNKVHYGTRNKLAKLGISCDSKTAVKLTEKDYEKYDYIIYMDKNNRRNILNIVGEDYDNKLYGLLDFTDEPRDISDPWYTGDFDKTYNDILRGLTGFLKRLGID